MFFTSEKKYKYDPNYHPTVTLLITAYNEETHIKPKIENSLKYLTTWQGFQIIIVNDGSTDKTVQYAQEFDNIQIIDLEHNGKTAAQNEGLKFVNGEIVVFSDANNIYDSGTIHNLVSRFSDERVGAVCGELKYTNEEVDEGLYWKYERMIKRLESRSGKLLGANGSIYAIRKKLYEPLRNDAISDFVEPIIIYGKGYDVVYEPRAIAYEEKPTSTFGRKKRIVLRSLVSLKYIKHLLITFSKRNIIFTLLSHKIIRWFIPIFMFLIFILNIYLFETNYIYQLLLMLQIIFYILGIYINTIKYFIVVNMASLMAIFAWIRGARIVTWDVERKKR